MNIIRLKQCAKARYAFGVLIIGQDKRRNTVCTQRAAPCDDFARRLGVACAHQRSVYIEQYAAHTARAQFLRRDIGGLGVAAVRAGHYHVDLLLLRRQARAFRHIARCGRIG
ncbi:MAG: hypothetical protein ABT01_05445 [Clostridium sp. SCN 57-10]|nr:MAG: hypothetical protein ABT01_05445 [Clostridium sp. SCN 57-10]